MNDWFKDESGQPISLYPGQNEIFDSIAKRTHKRVHCISYTQYGKSLTVALAILTRVSTMPEKWAIVAPSNKKAKIIMGYIIDHIFDNEYTASKFEMSKGENREKIRRERSKERINFRISNNRLGEVFVISTEGRRVRDTMDALMGFGAPNVVLDESSLVDDPQYAAVKRMVGGTKDNFIFEIGNPFRRNHFFRSSRDPLYHKIHIDVHRGVEEGRIDEDFVEEMRGEAGFEVLYECKFPDENAADSDGYFPLISTKMLDGAFIQDDIEIYGEKRLGCDVAGGGSNYSVIVLRGDNGAKILFREKIKSTMEFVAQIMKYKDKYKIHPENIFVDSVGVGQGVADRLKEHYGKIGDLNVGNTPEKRDAFTNQRAEAYWRLQQWLKKGSRLKKHKSWDELLEIKYTIQSDKKIKIKTKKDMLKEGVVSPDVADALMLTFVRKRPFIVNHYKQPEYEPISEYEG